MEESEIRQRILQRHQQVEERIAAACKRSGRTRSELTLVAVTKTVSLRVAELLPGLGIADLGESRPQVLWSKARQLPGVRWHLIGHLQTNKVERTLPLSHMIHSVDSPRLLRAIDQAAERLAKKVPVLLEVNVSGEASKQGLSPRELGQINTLAADLKNAPVVGLMTMAPNQEPEATRPTFAKLRALRDGLQERLGPLPHLSMGMSNDFEVAIEEGATLIRLGSVLFEGLEP